MSDGELAVHYGSVEQTASDIERVAARLQEEIEKMRSAVSNVAEGWEGEAHNMMQQADAIFHARSVHIQQTLKDVANRVRTGSAQYHATDKKASQLFDISY